MDLPFLHPDQSEFIPIRRDGGLYVDKTGHLRRLLAPVGDGSRLRTKYAFLARPRRFGKTLLVSTLEAYFQGDLRGWRVPTWLPLTPIRENGPNCSGIPSSRISFTGTRRIGGSAQHGDDSLGLAQGVACQAS